MNSQKNDIRAWLASLNPRYAIYALTVFLLLKAGFLLHVTRYRELIMDEFSQGYKSRLIGEFYVTFTPVKNVLYAYLYNIPSLFTNKADEMVIGARFESLAFMLGTILLTYFISMRLYRNNLLALGSIATLLSFSNFFEQAFTIRSETCALFFAMGGLLSLTVSIEHNRQRYRWELLGGAFLALAFLCTQKSIYFTLAFGIAALLIDRNLRQNVIANIYMAFGFIVIIAAYALFMLPKDPLSVIVIMLIGPTDVALNSANFYPDIGKYKLQTLVRNPIAYSLFGLAVIIGLRQLSALTIGQRFALFSSIILGLFIFLHNQPWPYVFTLLLPIVSTVAMLALSKVPRYQTVAILGLILLLSASFKKNVDFSDHLNQRQLQVVAIAESLLNEGDTYGDGIGMIFSRDRAAPHIGLDTVTRTRIRQDAASGNFEKIDAFFDDNPKLWILTYRLAEILQFSQDRFKTSYAQIYPNIMIAGSCAFDGGTLNYPNYWLGEYSLYSLNGEPLNETWLIDGVSVEKSFSLVKQTYNVSRENGEGFCLLPKGIQLPKHNQGSQSHRLFAHFYQ